MRSNRFTCHLSLWAFRLSGSLLAFLLPATAAHAQSYSPLCPPNSSICTQWWSCVDLYTGRIIPYCSVNLYTVYYPYTNAHLHESSGHPRSSMVCVNPGLCSPSSGQWIAGNTGASGYLGVYIITTLIGQAEYVWGMSAYGTGYSNYAVGYGDVHYNDHPEIWMRIGGTDTGGGTGHGTTYYNRYMMINPAYGLYYATYDYLALHPGQTKVCTNDMALPYGGKFDINQNWTSPHAAHDRGTAVDVAGPGSAQCPDNYEVNVADFLVRCVARGALSAYSVPEGNHVHCNWANPSTYPH